jgi:uncharacterized phiE125 gp8 family phage protein
MWTNLRRIAVSNTPIVSNTIAKSQCRISATNPDDDAYIDFLIGVAQDFIEGPDSAGIPLLTQTWTATFDRLYYDTGLILPLCPVQSVNSVVYQAMDGSYQTLDPAVYQYNLSAAPVRVARAYNQSFPATLPVMNAVTVTFTCGYGDDVTSIPRDIQHAALLLIGTWYTNRESTVGIGSRDSPQEIPDVGAVAILNKYRAIAFA